ncbi:SDR family oxidoreductase [Beduini massiliensis]|uniref:SDR family oxidoreductase n=1 Tax=Beduini massiliensis TaxID=1585974 RepID=UPI00059A9CEF|nr:SDR family oxidoreductase [Beduini massiliensis]
MNFDFNEKKPVVVLLGAGSMGMAIVRRIAGGKKVLLGDISEQNLEKAENDLKYSGYDVETCVVDAMNRESIQAFAQKAAALGNVMYFIDTAEASPSQASPEHILKLDLLGTAYALDEFGKVIGEGGAGLIISSMTGYMPNDLTKEDELALVNTPTESLLSLPCLSSERIKNSGTAYVVSKRANHMRVQSAAMTWGKRKARINTISPGIVVTPLAYDEFNSEGNSYQQMIEASARQRVGTSDEIAAAGAFLLSDDAAFITGTDLLIDGGMIAAINSGKMKMNIR